MGPEMPSKWQEMASCSDSGCEGCQRRRMRSAKSSWERLVAPPVIGSWVSLRTVIFPDISSSRCMVTGECFSSSGSLQLFRDGTYIGLGQCEIRALIPSFPPAFPPFRFVLLYLLASSRFSTAFVRSLGITVVFDRLATRILSLRRVK